jgi:hypothetical protein
VNTVLSTPVDQQHQHPPQPPQHEVTVRRVGLPDRIALHVGLALITWSRRPSTRRSGSNDRHRRSAEQAKREWQAERTQRLILPPR